MKYIHSFIYLYQYPEKISKILDSIVKLTKKEIDYEKIEELTKTNLDIDKKNTTIQFDDEIDTDFFSNNKKEEEIFNLMVMQSEKMKRVVALVSFIRPIPMLYITLNDIYLLF